ncbi:MULTISPECIES: epoxide hydrolase family protein [Saccharibacillus]|uniref:epoxide hydrolase family protein n=1 Tax=Saccharibacillus TaxID=456492 RepID=UPI00123AFC6F|nr:epoxide hydrolase family protein [Saccharibacillus sp. WB 17]MWJ30406.1 alpha/beta fold hydrolase [Saccharibacillus sp. WB 17]
MPNEQPIVQPYRIDIPQSDLDDLQQRLSHTRWPEEAPGGGWNYGVPLSYMRELADYWRSGYDWRTHEAELNAYPQFMTQIGGENIHFLHIRSPEPDALPLLLLHGWPGSIVEFLDLIGPLTRPQEYGRPASDAFHLVIPSLPGYGFSGPTSQAGLDDKAIAGMFVTLMKRLGYERYGTQGGDWGSVISLEIGARDPGSVVGVHVNMLMTPPPENPKQLAKLKPRDREQLDKMKHYAKEQSGYSVQQGTRPQTLSYALTDSPSGQLAWIIEKFYEWTDKTGLPEEAIHRDRLLTNVTIYWLTATAGSSARLYYEKMHTQKPPLPEGLSSKEAPPLGVAMFPKDVSYPIRALAEEKYNVRHWTEFDRGGHFAALEQPELLSGDIIEFFRKIRT